jgi:hypothetical protein
VPDIVPFEVVCVSAGPAAADTLPPVLGPEPGAAVPVGEIGPATVAPVSDVWAATGVSVIALLLFAADAAFAPPLQAAAKMMTTTRTERYIFPEFC